MMPDLTKERVMPKQKRAKPRKSVPSDRQLVKLLEKEFKGTISPGEKARLAKIRLAARRKMNQNGKRLKATSINDWRSTIGMFAGDPVMKQIIEEGRRIREADR